MTRLAIAFTIAMVLSILEAALIVGAHAQQMPSGMMVSAPPARYDHAYRGSMNTVIASVGETRALCRKAGLIDADACSWVSKGVCTIIVPNNGPDPSVTNYRRHETAHCNGWAGNHPK